MEKALSHRYPVIIYNDGVFIYCRSQEELVYLSW